MAYINNLFIIVIFNRSIAKCLQPNIRINAKNLYGDVFIVAENFISEYCPHLCFLSPL